MPLNLISSHTPNNTEYIPKSSFAKELQKKLDSSNIVELTPLSLNNKNNDNYEHNRCKAEITKLKEDIIKLQKMIKRIDENVQSHNCITDNFSKHKDNPHEITTCEKYDQCNYKAGSHKNLINHKLSHHVAQIDKPTPMINNDDKTSLNNDPNPFSWAKVVTAGTKKKGACPNTTNSMNDRIRKHMDELPDKPTSKINTTIITNKQKKIK